MIKIHSAPDRQRPIIKDYGGNPYARPVGMAKLAQKDGVIEGILGDTENPGRG